MCNLFDCAEDYNGIAHKRHPRQKIWTLLIPFRQRMVPVSSIRPGWFLFPQIKEPFGSEFKSVSIESDNARIIFPEKV